MARAQVVQNEVVVELTLSLQEALYVYGALCRTTPVPGLFEPGDDPVYIALGDAIGEAGHEPSNGLTLSERR